jgi:hypothetical protein
MKSRMKPEVGGVEVRRSRIAGTGVVATRALPARTLLQDISRPLVRYSKVPQKGDPGYGHAIQLRRGWWLLLDHTPFYYLNHSCEPNAILEMRGTRARVVTAQRVRTGEELTLDYGTVAFADDPYEIVCRCGTRSCRGVVRGRRRPPMRRRRATGRGRSAPRPR